MDEKKIYVTRSSMPSYEEYIEAIKPLWDTHWLTNMGEYHQKLEQNLQAYLKVPGISLMVNGHMALEMAIQMFDFPQGSEIITTPFTFVSTTHAIVRNGLRPVFCDVKTSDGTIDETKIENCITEKTVAILPVHVYGNICNIDEIERIATKYNLKVIYDAAHAFGVEYKGRGIGSFGDAAVFSFHATKVYNTIEGGAVAFSDINMYEKLYNLKNFGIRGEELVVSIGANAKMNEFSAIMGLCNLKHVDEDIKKRNEIWNIYKDELEGVKELSILINDECPKYNYAYFPIIIQEESRVCRDELYEMLKRKNIYTRKYFYPLTSDNACFNDKYKHISLQNARELAARVLVLPLYAELEKEIVRRIACEIREAVSHEIRK